MGQNPESDKDREADLGKIYAAHLADATKPALTPAQRTEFSNLLAEPV
jgi:hypothetical protein